jgi:hypothetical protein
MALTRSVARATGIRPRAMPLPRRGTRPTYKPQDECHRHRLPDRKRKTVSVTTYTRRKPS